MKAKFHGKRRGGEEFEKAMGMKKIKKRSSGVKEKLRDCRWRICTNQLQALVRECLSELQGLGVL